MGRGEYCDIELCNFTSYLFSWIGIIKKLPYCFGYHFVLIIRRVCDSIVNFFLLPSHDYYRLYILDNVIMLNMYFYAVSFPEDEMIYHSSQMLIQLLFGAIFWINDTMCKSIIKYTNDKQDDWDDHIDPALMSYRTSIHKSNYIPNFQAFMGDPRLLMEDLFPIGSQYESLDDEEKLQAALEHQIAAVVSFLG